MPTNMTPEMLAALQAYLQSHPGGSYADPSTGRQYQPTYAANSMRTTPGQEGDFAGLGQTGYYSPNGADRYDAYGLNGANAGNYAYGKEGSGGGPIHGYGDSSLGAMLKDAAPGLLAVLAAGAGAGLMGAGGAAEGAAGSGVAGGAGGWLEGSSAGMQGLAGSNAAFNSAMAGAAGAGGVGGAGLLSGAGPSTSTMGAGAAGGLEGSGAGMSGMAGSSAAFNSALAGGAGLGTLGAAGSGLSGILGGLGSGSSLLGLGASLLGGALGSKGVQSTVVKDIPAWLKPYAEKNLGYASGLLDKQMAPGYMQGYDDMRSVGQGLLNQPIAGNGMARFFPGR